MHAEISPATLQAEVSGVGMADGAVLVREESSEVDHKRVTLQLHQAPFMAFCMFWGLHSTLLLQQP